MILILSYLKNSSFNVVHVPRPSGRGLFLLIRSIFNNKNNSRFYDATTSITTVLSVSIVIPFTFYLLETVESGTFYTLQRLLISTPCKWLTFWFVLCIKAFVQWPWGITFAELSTLRFKVIYSIVKHSSKYSYDQCLRPKPSNLTICFWLSLYSVLPLHNYLPMFVN